MSLAQVRDLAQELVANDGERQHWIAIAGGPGAGKSTLACALRDELAARGKRAVVLPMDGFHLYRAQLDRFEDAAHMHARRGAPFTFDAPKYRRYLEQLRRDGKGRWPSFDHGNADPVEDDIELDTADEIVLVEGSYLLLDETPWREARALFHERWFIHVHEETARIRVAKRNSAAWGWKLEETLQRVDANDVLNMRLVEQSRVHATRVLSGD